MSLVFVHGIGNRAGSTYDADVRLRDALFERFLIDDLYPDPAGPRILNPLWGNYGARLHWDGRCLEDAVRESLGQHDLVAEAAVLAGANPNQALTRVARADLRDGIDLLFSLTDLRDRDAAEVADLADLALALVRYCDAAGAHSGAEPPAFGWLADVGDDLDLVDGLARAVSPPPLPGRELLGSRWAAWTAARDILVDTIERLRRESVTRPVGSAALAFHRMAAKPVSLLLGDVLTYFEVRGTREEPGQLVAVVIADLERAAVARPLVVVAHSMGATVAYDILTYFRPDIDVDVLVTVGSQVGLFEELKLFRASDRRLPGAAGDRVPTLPNVRRWINIFDRTDLLAYRAEGIFDGVVDLHYSTHVVRAHGAYFKQPNFHSRMAARVQELLS